MVSMSTPTLTRATPRPAEPGPSQRPPTGWPVAGVAAAALAAAAVFVPVVIMPALTGGTAMTVMSGSMAPALPVGTIGVYHATDPDLLKVGDIIAYRPATDITGGVPITHRIIATDGLHGPTENIIVQGDANTWPDPAIRADQVLGTLTYMVPYAGLPKVAAHEHGLHGLLKGLGAALAGTAVLLLASCALRKRGSRAGSAHVPG